MQLICSRNSPHFMESESSLSHFQTPATCSYPWPAVASLRDPARFLEPFIPNFSLKFQQSGPKKFSRKSLVLKVQKQPLDNMKLGKVTQNTLKYLNMIL